jgi:hypothetical protein
LDGDDDGKARAGTPIVAGYDEDTINNDTLASSDNGEEKASELDNGDAASSYEIVTPRADTSADAIQCGSLGATTLGQEAAGMLEYHTLDSDAEMADVSDGLSLRKTIKLTKQGVRPPFGAFCANILE